MNVPGTRLKRRVEEASLNAWPAAQQMLYDGWVVRFSSGYTKRANSVNPLYESTLDLGHKIDTCEGLYADRGLPAIFRLNRWSSPAELDAILDRRGYRRHAPTTVMTLGLEGASFGAPAASEMREVSLEEWLVYFSAFSGAHDDANRLHKRILSAIPSRCLRAILVDRGKVVACSLGVLDGGFLGLFDLVTDPAHRRKGHGSSLVAAQLEWALEQGAGHAYLQVVDENTPARGLYAGLGFEPLYGYWYRVGQTG
jgi:GNAT superfamily N-acetyltransferase